MRMVQAVEHWTRAKLLALLPDGMRHELIDGVHVVSPAPRFWHQRVIEALADRL